MELLFNTIKNSPYNSLCLIKIIKPTFKLFQDNLKQQVIYYNYLATYGIQNFLLMADTKLVSSDLKSSSFSLDSWIATEISKELNLETTLCPGFQILGVLKSKMQIRRLIL